MKKIIYTLLAKAGYKIENKNNEIKFRKNNLSKFDVIKQKDLLLKSFLFVQNLSQKFPEIKLIDSHNGILVTFNNIKVYVESYEEFFILNEIFVENDYNFLTNDKVVLIDIGSNIGISCLFFSLMPNVEKIYGFEPVEDTFNQAKLNLEMNKDISKVEHLYNFGLGKNTRDEIFLFNKNVKGNTGVRGALSTSYQSNSVIEINVKIQQASTEILKIIEANLNQKIAIKMDCEGGEYEIFESLIASKTLSKIDYIMMEWHDRGANLFEQALKEHNFICFSKRLAFNSGMIYAVKNN